MSTGYRRALLKISGEALAGEKAYGLDPAKVAWIADQLAQSRRDGRDIAVVVGGGNILRGRDATAAGVPRLAGDQMGMIATVLNGMALQGALQSIGLAAAVMSAFAVGTFVEPFARDKALDHLSRGHVVIFVGGTGNPCFTTDSAAALRAVEIEADLLIKGTQVKGVYDRDPHKDRNAVLLERISAEEILERRLGVVDAACADLLWRHRIPAIVLDVHEDGNIGKALRGERVGTFIG